ncbi:lytic transglycosylase [Lutibacter citreus]|uniref:lytic transglycosylase n=1 Tax=Lutibacter citreus TaxID=2138210 RepID=UPI000DBE9903|nr:LysM domain-containing protein [Lutibacter citreus]
MRIIKFVFSILMLCTITLVAQQKKYVPYTVQKGETIKSIAKVYKISRRDLMKLNPDVGRKPKANTVIIVPNINYGKIIEVKDDFKGEYHIVKPKETLYGISKKNNVTIEELKALNPQLATGLKIGMKIKIPIQEEINKDLTEVTYVLHTVVKDDTVYNLTKRFEVTEDELLKLNPTLKEGLKLGMVLKIRLKEGLELTEGDELLDESSLFVENLNFNKTLNVAIMLPYQIDKYTDSTRARSFGNNNSILSIATDFHMGAEIAIDSLKRKGLKINVSYFDTEKSNYKLKTIVDKNDFRATDVIIGPLFYEKAHWLSKQVDVPVIAPVYSKKQKDLSGSNLVKSDSNDLESILLDYMKKIYAGENVIIINDGKADSQSNLWKAVSTLKSFDSIQNVSVIKSNDGYINNSNFAEKLSLDSNNWIFLISDENVTTAAAINNLKGFKEEYNITLFSVNKGKNFDTIDNSFLGQLNFIFASKDFINVEDANVKRFYSHFRSENNSNPSKFAVRGFDVTYDVLARLASKESFEEALKAGKSSRISSKFNYSKKQFGSFENNAVYIVHYNSDLSSIILK